MVDKVEPSLTQILSLVTQTNNGGYIRKWASSYLPYPFSPPFPQGAGHRAEWIVL